MQNARFLRYLGDVLLDGGEDNQDLDGGSGFEYVGRGLGSLNQVQVA